MELEEGRTYKLVFDAKSTVERLIDVGFKVTDTNRYLSETVTVGEEWQTYTFVFTVDKPTNNQIQLIAHLGKYIDDTPTSTLTFDNFKLYLEVPVIDTVAPKIIGVEDSELYVGEDFDPLSGIKVSDNKDIDISVDDI
ncbi:MAG: hypothetical protein GX490_09770, partial [Bacilli bacterium]|nr:hypothetical protein [Bacilli bacterium]